MVNTERGTIGFIPTSGEMMRSGNRLSPLGSLSHLNEIVDIKVLDGIRVEAGAPDPSVEQIAEMIHAQMSQHSGFVVTVGKYDIQHLAPRLAFALGPNLNKTVVVAGTNISADFPHSRAPENLVEAAMIANMPFREVVISFGDCVVRGTDSRARSMGSSSNLIYESRSDPKYGHLGEITGSGVEVNHLRSPQEGKDSFHNDFETKILAFSATPGFQAELYEDAAFKSKGVIIEMPDWALPIKEPYSILPLIDDITRRNIPVMLTSRVDDTLMGAGESHSERMMEVFRGVVGRFMGIETATAKFSWAIRVVDNEIAQGKLSESDKLARVKDLIQRPYVGEFGIHRPFNEFEV